MANTAMIGAGHDPPLASSHAVPPTIRRWSRLVVTLANDEADGVARRGKRRNVDGMAYDEAQNRVLCWLHSLRASRLSYAVAATIRRSPQR
jgi:hypothetical protein